jgi:hypothetical protein
MKEDAVVPTTMTDYREYTRKRETEEGTLENKERLFIRSLTREVMQSMQPE